MQVSDFDYDLPPDLIAQDPTAVRDTSRLLVLSRPNQSLSHRSFSDLAELLSPSDLLVINNSRVIKARLRGINPRTGGRFELLLLEETAPNEWWTMTKPGRRAHPGTQFQLLDPSGNVIGIQAEVIAVNAEGHRHYRFHHSANILDVLPAIGELPLPPYIKRAGPRATDDERYQTVYAQPLGSLAAPTAGLHFTPGLMAQLRAKGIEFAEVTLHVGLGTFAPVKAENVADHPMHEERYAVTSDAAIRINAARQAGRRVIAVGTTALRVLETVGRANAGLLVAGSGRTRIFIHPPSTFSVVDGLITNFHLPRSTLLMLVSAFASPGDERGRPIILHAYATAIRERYRFFSYGDAMLIV